MGNKKIIEAVGLWKFLMWFFLNKVLKKKAIIPVSFKICPNYCVRECINHEGYYKSIVINNS